MNTLKFEFALVGNEILADVELKIENGTIVSVETDAVHTPANYHCSGLVIPAIPNVHSPRVSVQVCRAK